MQFMVVVVRVFCSVFSLHVFICTCPFPRCCFPHLYLPPFRPPLIFLHPLLFSLHEFIDYFLFKTQSHIRDNSAFWWGRTIVRSTVHIGIGSFEKKGWRSPGNWADIDHVGRNLPVNPWTNQGILSGLNAHFPGVNVLETTSSTPPQTVFRLSRPPNCLWILY